MLNLVLQTVEEAEGGGFWENLGILRPETSELIAGVIAFAIVFFFIWKWALPTINRTLEARQDAITGQLQEAESTKQEAESLLEDYRKQIAGAKDEANQIVEEARVAADSVRSEIVQRAETGAAEIVSKARAEADSEKSRALEEARQEVANISLDLAEKVVGEALDRDAQKGLVDRYLADLERMSE